MLKKRLLQLCRRKNRLLIIHKLNKKLIKIMLGIGNLDIKPKKLGRLYINNKIRY